MLDAKRKRSANLRKLHLFKSELFPSDENYIDKAAPINFAVVRIARVNPKNGPKS